MLTPLALTLVVLTALVDKLIPSGLPIVRVGSLLALNVLLFLAAQYLIQRFSGKAIRPVVAAIPFAVENAGIKEAGISDASR